MKTSHDLSTICAGLFGFNLSTLLLATDLRILQKRVICGFVLTLLVLNGFENITHEMHKVPTRRSTFFQPHSCNGLQLQDCND